MEDNKYGMKTLVEAFDKFYDEMSSEGYIGDYTISVVISGNTYQLPFIEPEMANKFFECLVALEAMCPVEDC